MQGLSLSLTLTFDDHFQAQALIHTFHKQWLRFSSQNKSEASFGNQNLLNSLSVLEAIAQIRGPKDERQ